MDDSIVVEGDMCSVTGERGSNEDYAIVLSHHGACLADGIGGEPMGDVVARCACKVAMKAMAEGGSASESLSSAQSYSKDLIDNLDCGRSGAALTVVRCDKEHMQVAWAGDVLCLHLNAKSGELRTITKPDRGRKGITNAVGMNGIRVNVAQCTIEEGDRILLCSDGVWENVDKGEMLSSLKTARTPREAAVRLVIGRGNRDDATAVVLFAKSAHRDSKDCDN